MIYHALNYRLDRVEGFLLWYSADADGVVIERGQVLNFDTLSHPQLSLFRASIQPASRA